MGNAPIRTRFYNIQHPIAHALFPRTPHLLNHRRWCHLAYKLKPYRPTENQHPSEMSTSVIAIVDILHGYSKQHGTISSFLAAILIYYSDDMM